MNEKNKGLADAQEGEFILNESGTAVSIDSVEGIDAPALSEPLKDDEQNNRNAKNNAENK